jgi:hypothetical protein
MNYMQNWWGEHNIIQMFVIYSSKTVKLVKSRSTVGWKRWEKQAMIQDFGDKISRKWPLGRKSISEYNIKMDIREVGCEHVNWNGLTLRIGLSGGNFLNN